MIEQKKVAGQNRNEAGETPAIPERGHPVRIDAVSAAEQVRSVTNGKELSELELNADDIAIDFTTEDTECTEMGTDVVCNSP